MLRMTLQILSMLMLMMRYDIATLPLRRQAIIG